jgi:hypothetical protein
VRYILLESVFCSGCIKSLIQAAAGRAVCELFAQTGLVKYDTGAFENFCRCINDFFILKNVNKPFSSKTYLNLTSLSNSLFG